MPVRASVSLRVQVSHCVRTCVNFGVGRRVLGHCPYTISINYLNRWGRLSTSHVQVRWLWRTQVIGAPLHDAEVYFSATPFLPVHRLDVGSESEIRQRRARAVAYGTS